MQPTSISAEATLQPTTEQAEQWHETVRKEWTHPAVAYGYRRWSQAETHWAHEATDLLLQHAEIQPHQHVVDLASGHGEPSIEIARRVGPRGRVVATDQNLELLCLGLKRALKEHLSQYEIEVADAHRLPLPSESFDRVTSRLGLMFFERPIDALREARRVLRPDGRAAFLVWGPQPQPFYESIARPFLQRLVATRTDPSAPGPFRLGAPGLLTRAMKAAGFQHVRETQAQIRLHFQGTPAEYWEYWNDTAPFFQATQSGLTNAQRDEATEEALRTIATYHQAGRIQIPATVNLVTGRR